MVAGSLSQRWPCPFNGDWRPLPVVTSVRDKRKRENGRDLDLHRKDGRLHGASRR